MPLFNTGRESCLFSFFTILLEDLLSSIDDSSCMSTDCVDSRVQIIVKIRDIDPALSLVSVDGNYSAILDSILLKMVAAKVLLQSLGLLSH